MTTRLSNAERFRRTRRALLDAGRALFADMGYARTTTGALVRRADVTRGALYYHFRDKAGLFEAVFEEVYQECLQAMKTCMETAADDPWERFLESLRVLMEQLGRPGVQRIVAVEGPAVLDSSRVRHEAPGPQFLHPVFEQLVAEGVLKPLPLAPPVSPGVGSLLRGGAPHCPDRDECCGSAGNDRRADVSDRRPAAQAGLTYMGRSGCRCCLASLAERGGLAWDAGTGNRLRRIHIARRNVAGRGVRRRRTRARPPVAAPYRKAD